MSEHDEIIAFSEEDEPKDQFKQNHSRRPDMFEPGMSHVDQHDSQLPQLKRMAIPAETIKHEQKLPQAEQIPQQHQHQQQQQQEIAQISEESSDEQPQQMHNQSIIDFNDQASQFAQSEIHEDDIPQIHQQEQLPQIENDSQLQQSQVQQRQSPFPMKLEPNRFPNSPAEIRQFLTNPLIRDRTLQCYIRRSKSGLARIYPVYHMFTTEGDKYLCSAKKVVLNTTSNYLISTRKDEFSRRKESFIGRVVSNFLGTEFLLYDDGTNPQKSKDMSKIRNQLGVVYYESHIMTNKGPRKMKILIPKVGELNICKVFQPMSDKEGMQFDYQRGTKEYIDELVNKPPKWDSKMKAHVLNFYGRVDQPSVKNFQLIDLKTPNFINLQFGRVDDLTFNLDFCWPLSPLQALQICVSSFDFKLACE